MSSEDGAPVAATPAHLVLGLPADATASRMQAAYWHLRAHIEERARDSSDPDFVARRDQEIEDLTRALRRAMGRAAGEQTARWRRAGPLAWALTATALAAFLAARLLLPGEFLQTPAAAAPPLARLRVDARPTGARLEILATQDDRVVDAGPADGSTRELAAGRYRLRVDRDDCPDGWRAEVTLAAGEEVSFAPRLCLGEGRLVVRSKVAGGRLLLDGLDAGSTGPDEHALAVGDHEVRVERQGFEPFVGRVRIRPDQSLSLQAELVASAATAPPPEPPSSPSSPGPSAAPSQSSAGPAASRGAAPQPGGPPLPPPSTLSSTEPPLRVARGGSKKWHDEVKQRLLDKHDADHSRSLDKPEEINAIACSEWRSIESSYESGGLAVAMTRLYGFDGSAWVPGALGVDEGMRGYAFARMRECGLRQQ